MFHRREFYKIHPIMASEAEEITCDNSFSFPGGDEGVYKIDVNAGTDVGYVRVSFGAVSIPDRFQIVYDGNIVADSLFVGGVLPNTSAENDILNANYVTEYEYIPVLNTFAPTGNSIQVNYTVADIATSDGTETRANGSGTGQLGIVANYPNASAKASDGDVALVFYKDKANVTNFELVVIGVSEFTSWNFDGMTCPMTPYYRTLTESECYDPVEVGLGEFFIPDGVAQGNVVYTSLAFTDTVGAGVYGYSTQTTGLSEFWLVTDASGTITSIGQCNYS